MPEKVFLIAIALSCLFPIPVKAQDAENDSLKTILASTVTTERSFQIPKSGLLIKRDSTKNTLEHWRRVRNQGRILTGFGVAAMTIGAITFSRNFSINLYGSSGSSGEGEAILFLAGLVATGGGITMWAIGGHHYKKESKVEIGASPAAAFVRYRF